jgi:hypothetical protein
VLAEAKDGILELAEKHCADLIAIGSHGRSGLKKFILGNVAQSVTHDAPCAVAVVRGIAPDDESWFETGAFEKEEPAPKEEASYRHEDEQDRMPGVVPGGMG